MKKTAGSEVAYGVLGNGASKELAQRLGRTPSDISLCLHGDRKLKKLRREIARVLGVDECVLWPKSERERQRHRAVMRYLIMRKGE